MRAFGAEVAAEELSAVIGSVKRGTLRVFGDWFGRPMDNIHTACAARADGDDLVVTFDDDEELRVSCPAEWEFSENVFQIWRATRVVWRWYYYGRSKIPGNRFTIEHWIDDSGAVRARSDAIWHTPVFAATSEMPAAELL